VSKIILRQAQDALSFDRPFGFTQGEAEDALLAETGLTQKPACNPAASLSLLLSSQPELFAISLSLSKAAVHTPGPKPGPEILAFSWPLCYHAAHGRFTSKHAGPPSASERD
jgi:hypothetical protein